MNQEVEQHINDVLDKVRTLLVAAATRIEAIKPGEKIPATDLAKELGRERGMTGPQLYPILKFAEYLDEYPGVIIRKGARGGIYRPLPGETLAKPVTDGDVVVDAATETETP
ncbi:MAG TPA: hypothetical protein VII94_00325 [Candidatus Saccharimonadales bacterium]